MTKGASIKSNRGGHGRTLSQKTLQLKKTNQFTVLEGVPEGGVQRKISDFTNSNLSRKRTLSPKKVSNEGAKKTNTDSNPNLIPLGTWSSKNDGAANVNTTSPTSATGADLASPSREASSSYASITSGVPSCNNNDSSQP